MIISRLVMNAPTVTTGDGITLDEMASRNSANGAGQIQIQNSAEGMRVIPIKQFNFVDIPKVATTSLKAMSLKEHGIDVGERNLHAFYDVLNLKNPNGQVVVVFRDPIDRFVSFWENKINKPNPDDLLPWYLHNKDKLGTLDDTIELCRKNIMGERHFAPQTCFIPEKFDFLVLLKDLNSFLEAGGIEVPPRGNKTDGEKVKLTLRQNIRLKAAYSKDYEFILNYKNRVWVKEQV